MIQPQQFKRLFDALTASSRVLVIAHKKPDGDALGSSSALYTWLKDQGKQATLFCKDLPNKNFIFLDYFHAYTNNPDVFKDEYDTVVVCDSGDPVYCGIDELLPRLPQKPLLINIDHHKTNQNYGNINIVDIEATSTSEIVAQFFLANQIIITPTMATSTLMGILTDTSHFSNAATTTTGMSLASELIRSGARINDITNYLLKNKNLEILHLWGLALSRMHKNETYDIATTYLTADDLLRANATPASVDGISNFLNAVTGNADTILVLTDLGNGSVKGSMRSVNRDVSKIAKQFGGGGHKLAAGFTIKGSIKETPNGFEII